MPRFTIRSFAGGMVAATICFNSFSSVAAETLRIQIVDATNVIGHARILNARVQNEGGYYSVFIKLDDEATSALDRFTAQNVGQPMQVVLGNAILLSATIRARVDSGLIRVGGDFTKDEADELVEKLLKNQ